MVKHILERAKEIKNQIDNLANSVDDSIAVKSIDLYPLWKNGIEVVEGMRYRYNDKLYKAKLSHTTQTDWTPDITPSMFDVIDVEHLGTIDDPIPASQNMEYIKGKYYVENGIIYLMNREGMEDGETITLSYMPSELVGHYFEVIK